MILSTDFINTNSSLKFDSTYSTIWNCFTMWNCYMKMLGSGRFFSLMKTMQVLPTPKWIDSLLSTNHLQIPCLKHFQFLQRAYVDASVYLIELVEYHSIYSKNNQGFNIDPWGTLQFMVPASENALFNDTKKVVFVR